jgi:polynucleotide 5'-hydroxyl-kinase GRC3/NOL9
MVLGGGDSGKTTLCRWLLSKFPPEARPALVDSDIGQATIGPPACIAWRFAGKTEFEFTFTGDITPALNPTATLSGTVRAVRAAESAGAGIVLMDTSGYLGGRGGFELKSGKLELLAPLHLICLGDGPDIKRLLAAWQGDPRLTILRLPQAEVLQQKSRQQRAAWRQKRFNEALAGAELRKISLCDKALSGLPTAAELTAAGHETSELQGLLLCFTDNQRRGVCLGLLHSLDLRNQELLVRAQQAAETATGLMFGTLRLTAEGLEIGRIV